MLLAVVACVNFAPYLFARRQADRSLLTDQILFFVSSSSGGDRVYARDCVIDNYFPPSFQFLSSTSFETRLRSSSTTRTTTEPLKIISISADYKSLKPEFIFMATVCAFLWKNVIGTHLVCAFSIISCWHHLKIKALRHWCFYHSVHYRRRTRLSCLRRWNLFWGNSGWKPWHFRIAYALWSYWQII